MKKQIKRLHLKNFQSHEETSLDFAPGLNVILGNSDSGKSAIVRAIRWLFYNEPMGADFLQRGKSLVEVTAEFYDGAILKRSRNKNVNAYDLTLGTGESMHFEGFGRSVPKEIVDYFKLRKFPLSPTEDLTLNIADQLEGPFLLQEKDSNKANAIGRLVGIHYIDQAQRNVNRDIKSLTQDLKYEQKTLDDLLEKKKDYDFIESKEKMLASLGRIIARGKEAEESRKNLEEKLTSYQSICANKKSSLVQIEKFQQLENSKKILREIKTFRRDLDQLRALNINIQNIRGNIGIFNQRLHELAHVDEAHQKLLAGKKLEEKYRKITLLQTHFSENQKLKDDFSKKINSLINLSKSKNLLTEMKEALERRMRLDKYAKGQEDLKNRFSIAEDYFKKFEYFNEAINLTEASKIQIQNLNTLKTFNQSYQALQGEMTGLRSQIDQVNKDLNLATKELEKILSSLKVCPICKRPLDEHTIENIVHH